ncbi:hypothetical protein VTJ04DRAFT_8258 [Mycothermus thermophilus]|uniref:uncharacterized protein n=1 Tax=Humicola insolens TaxID=85995 RepID=UPI0037440643
MAHIGMAHGEDVVDSDVEKGDKKTPNNPIQNPVEEVVENDAGNNKNNLEMDNTVDSWDLPNNDGIDSNVTSQSPHPRLDYRRELERSNSDEDDQLLAIKDWMPYEDRLFRYLFNQGRREPEPMFLKFRNLQRLNLIRLQNDINRINARVWKEGRLVEEDSTRLTSLLHDYSELLQVSYVYLAPQLTILLANALRDYEYLGRLEPITGSQARLNRVALEQAFGLDVGEFTDDGNSYGRFPDAHQPSSDNLRDFLKRHLPRSVTYTRREKWRRTEEYLRGEPPVEVFPAVDRLARFLVALIGGLSLVVPMLVMRLPYVDVTKSLVTVSVAVLLFAGSISVFFHAGNTETMITTATYAAVLAVFLELTA